MRVGCYCIEATLAPVMQPTALSLPQNTRGGEDCLGMFGESPPGEGSRWGSTRAVGNVPGAFCFSELLLTGQGRTGKLLWCSGLGGSAAGVSHGLARVQNHHGNIAECHEKNRGLVSPMQIPEFP